MSGSLLVIGKSFGEFVSLHSKCPRTSRMKSDLVKELFRIQAVRKMGQEQFGRARSEERTKMWKKRVGGGERRQRLPANG